MLHRQDRLDEARTAVEEVISMSPNYFGAYDLKATICADAGDYASAQQTLSRAAERSPRNWTRKRKLSTIALHNGDAETATAVMREVMQNDSVAGVSLADNLALARCALASGDEAAAKAALPAVKSAKLDGMELADRVEAECVLAVLEGKAGATRYERMRRLMADLPSDVPVQTCVDIARAALIFDDRQTSDRTVEKMLVGKQARLAFQPLLAIYQEHGLEEHFRNVQNRAAHKRLNKA